MKDLKPCPFCGGEAHVAHGHGYLVFCDRCWVHQSYLDMTEAEAVEAWNTRVKPPCKGNYCPLCGAVKRTCHNLRQRGYNYLECSLCGEKSYQGDKVFNYCPNCGAEVVD